MKRAVIIGAGPAGITAGLELLKKSGEYEVVILEESRRIGGISATVSCEGNRMDLGGHWQLLRARHICPVVHG